jgi:hypothetical protein
MIIALKSQNYVFGSGQYNIKAIYYEYDRISANDYVSLLTKKFCSYKKICV